MRRKWAVMSLVGISVITMILFIVGFIFAVQEITWKKETNVKPVAIKEKADKNDTVIVALGDSLTRGIGDEEALGYVGRFKKLYNQQSATYMNLSVSGAKSKDIIPLLSENGAQHTLKQGTMIFITMGGNDVFPGWESIQTIDPSSYKGDVEQFKKDVATILTTIRQVNKDAPIYWFSLYNPFEEITELKGTNVIVSNWNSALEQVAGTFNNIYIIPTYDIFQGQTKALLYSDQFHPNDQGYELMAQRLFQKIQSQEKGEK